MYKWDDKINISILEYPGEQNEYEFYTIKIKNNNKIIVFEASLIWLEWMQKLVEYYIDLNKEVELRDEWDENKLVFYNILIHIDDSEFNLNFFKKKKYLDGDQINNIFNTIKNKYLYVKGIHEFKKHHIRIQMSHNQLSSNWIQYNILFPT